VLQELRAVNNYGEHGYQIFFWRTKNGLEVDFVLYGPKGLLAIEVKRSATLQPSDLRGLREFRKDYKAAVCYVFHGGNVPQYFCNPSEGNWRRYETTQLFPAFH
jgi:uncharacterized protein